MSDIDETILEDARLAGLLGKDDHIKPLWMVPWYDAMVKFAQLREARKGGEAVAKERDIDWVMAMGLALGVDSKYQIPIAPSVDDFKELFSVIAAPPTTKAAVRKTLEKLDATIEFKLGTLRLVNDSYKEALNEIRYQIGALIEQEG